MAIDHTGAVLLPARQITDRHLLGEMMPLP